MYICLYSHISMCAYIYIYTHIDCCMHKNTALCFKLKAKPPWSSSGGAGGFSSFGRSPLRRAAAHVKGWAETLGPGVQGLGTWTLWVSGTVGLWV